MTGAKAIGVPGWPDSACCTASIDKVRIVLMQSAAIDPSHDADFGPRASLWCEDATLLAIGSLGSGLVSSTFFEAGALAERPRFFIGLLR